MIRFAGALLVVCGGLTLAACSKSADTQPVPVPSGSAAAVAADGTGANPTPPPPPPRPVVPVPPPAHVGESIDACCAALNAVRSSGRGTAAKAKAAQAASVCGGIASLVKSGATPKAAAMTQIRSALTGTDIPPECH